MDTTDAAEAGRAWSGAKAMVRDCPHTTAPWRHQHKTSFISAIKNINLIVPPLVLYINNESDTLHVML